MIFGKKVVEYKKRISFFCSNFFRNISHFKKKLSIYYQKYKQIFMKSIRNSCQILNKLEFLIKFSNIKFHENMSSGGPVFPCGRRAGGRTDKKLIDALRSFSNAPKNGTQTLHDNMN
jgi:hypothetical protein